MMNLKALSTLFICVYIFVASPSVSANSKSSVKNTSVDCQNSLSTVFVIDYLHLQKILLDLIGKASHPLATGNFDSAAINRAHRTLSKAFKHYDTLYQLKTSNEDLTAEKWNDLARSLDKEIRRLHLFSNQNKKFALLESLRLLQIIEARVKRPTPEAHLFDPSWTPAPKENLNNELSESTDHQSTPAPSPPLPAPSTFQWNSPLRNYSFRNKNLDINSPHQKPLIVLKGTVHTQTRRYPREYMEGLSASGFRAIPLIRPTPVALPEPTSSEKIIYLRPPEGLGLNRTQIIEAIPIPEGFIPESSTKTVIEASLPQEYSLHYSMISPGGAETTSPFIPIKLNPISHYIWNRPDDLVEHTRPSGIKEDQWPPLFLKFIKQLKPLRQSVKERTLAVVNFLNGDNFLYYGVGDVLNENQFKALEHQYLELKKTLPELLAMAHLKAMNCDGAAPMAVALLRDFFGIPSRIVVGLMAESALLEENGKIYEIITTGAIPHAWFEVWDESSQNWISFYSQPLRNNPNHPQSPLDQTLLNRTPSADQDSRLNSESNPSDISNNQSHETQDPQSLKGDADSKDGESDRSVFESEPPSNDRITPGEEREIESLKPFDSQKGALSELSEPRWLRHNPNFTKLKILKNENLGLVDQMMNSFFVYHLRKGLVEGYSKSFRQEFSHRTLRFLQAFEYLPVPIRNDFYSTLTKKLDFIATFSESSEKDLVSRLKNLTLELTHGNLILIWNELQALKRQLNEVETLDHLTLEEQNFGLRIKKTLEELQNYRHENSPAFELGQRLFKALPGSISKSLLRTKYPHFDQVGHIDSLTLAQNMISGKEQSLIHMAAVSPYVHLFLESELVPLAQKLQTQQRSMDTHDEPDIIRTRRIADFPRMILQPRPGEHLFAPTFRGDQLAYGQTVSQQVFGQKDLLYRSLNYLYYDVSGSMKSNHKRIVVQDALIKSFIDWTLSQKDDLGLPLHRNFLIPFNDVIGDRLEISSPEEAQQVINLKQIPRLKMGKDGTAIEAVIMDFFDRVSLDFIDQTKKQALSTIGLKMVNLVIFSDGEDHVSYDAVRARQKEVFDLTGIFFNLRFVSIEKENPTLKRLATTLGQPFDVASTVSRFPLKIQNPSVSTYYFIDGPKINRIVAGTDFRTFNGESFAFDQKQQLPPGLQKELAALRSSGIFEMPLATFEEFDWILKDLNSRVHDETQFSNEEPPHAVLELRDFKKFILNESHLERELRMTLIETALRSYLATFQSKRTSMSRVEARILIQLIQAHQGIH